MATTCTDRTWLEARLEKTKTLIVAYEDAITSLATGAVQSYQLDTGQTRQLVTKVHLGALQRTLDSLENRYSTLQLRLGCGRSHARPAF